jgi:predicted component of viral defense system (DUF524 family)
MIRFACQRVTLQAQRFDTQLELSLYDASWRAIANSQETVGPYQVLGRALLENELYAGLIASSEPPFLSISEKGEYQLVAKFHQPQSSPSFWPELSQAGLCRDDPSSLLDNSGRSARLQVHGITGILRVTVKVSNRTIASMPLRVMPYKLDYETDLKLLLRELALVAASLLLRTKRVATFTVLSRAYKPSPLETLIILQAIMRPSWVPRAMALISKNPHHELENQLRLLPYHKLGEALPEQVVLSLVRDGIFHKEKKIIPRKLRVQQRRICFDTPENRFVMAFYERLQRERRRLYKAFQRAPEMLGHVKFLSRKIELLTVPFPQQEISSQKPKAPSLYLRRKQGYREVWLASRLLGKELNTEDTASFEAPGRTLPVLYENWCLLILARCLASMAGVKLKTPYPLFLQTDGVFRFKTGVMQAIAPGVSLGYQMQFQTLRASSLQLRPDFLIELFGKKLVFDAKYRLSEDALSPQHEDMMVAHAYKDALQVDGSFVLYPGKGEAMIHRQAPPLELPAVGAFPLRPQEKFAHGEEMLRHFLQSCLSLNISIRKAAEQRAPYGEEK